MHDECYCRISSCLRWILNFVQIEEDSFDMPRIKQTHEEISLESDKSQWKFIRKSKFENNKRKILLENQIQVNQF